MTTTAEKIKVMQAFEDGVEIQWKRRKSMPRRSSVWHDTPSPSWDWNDNNYRIKPPDPKSLEHINEIRRRQSAAEDEIKKIGEELALLRYPELKATAPELLECYINVVDVGTDPLDGTKALQAYWTKEEAIEPVYGGPTRTQAGVLMRQVTPQDKENELNARRYHWWKNHFPPPKPGSHFSIEGWDNIADKAMEE